MQVEKVMEGEYVSMPLSAIGEKGDGCVMSKASGNGILVNMDPRESSIGVIFLPERDLEEAGYFLSKPSEVAENTEDEEK